MMFEILKDLLFPKICFGCGRWGEYLCSDCLNKIKVSDKRICPACGRPAVGGKTHPVCKKRYSLDGLTSVFEYSGFFKRILKKLKYRFVFDVSQDLVELFLTSLGEDIVFTQILSQHPRGDSLLIPVPLHPSRERWRGFNQAKLLGESIAQNLGIKIMPDLLLRIKKTKPQVFLKKEERQKNIRGAFTLNPNLPKSSNLPNILLFDDVWTTGATLRECTRVLKRKGASFVWGLTLAS